MTDSQRKESQEHAWKHFTLHAQQRMTSVQFFIALCTVILGGVVLSSKDAGMRALGVAFAFSLPVLSFVFWKLDDRARQLIRVAESRPQAP